MIAGFVGRKVDGAEMQSRQEAVGDDFERLERGVIEMENGNSCER